MTADQCLDHPWLRRKIPPPPPELITTKENLKSFIDNYHNVNILAENDVDNFISAKPPALSAVELIAASDKQFLNRDSKKSFSNIDNENILPPVRFPELLTNNNIVPVMNDNNLAMANAPTTNDEVLNMVNANVTSMPTMLDNECAMSPNITVVQDNVQNINQVVQKDGNGLQNNNVLVDVNTPVEVNVAESGNLLTSLLADIPPRVIAVPDVPVAPLPFISKSLPAAAAMLNETIVDQLKPMNIPLIPQLPLPDDPSDELIIVHPPVIGTILPPKRGSIDMDSLVAKRGSVDLDSFTTKRGSFDGISLYPKNESTDVDVTNSLYGAKVDDSSPMLDSIEFSGLAPVSKSTDLGISSQRPGSMEKENFSYQSYQPPPQFSSPSPQGHEQEIFPHEEPTQPQPFTESFKTILDKPSLAASQEMNFDEISAVNDLPTIQNDGQPADTLQTVISLPPTTIEPAPIDVISLQSGNLDSQAILPSVSWQPNTPLQLTKDCYQPQPPAVARILSTSPVCSSPSPVYQKKPPTISPVPSLESLPRLPKPMASSSIHSIKTNEFTSQNDMFSTPSSSYSACPRPVASTSASPINLPRRESPLQKTLDEIPKLSSEILSSLSNMPSLSKISSYEASTSKTALGSKRNTSFTESNSYSNHEKTHSPRLATYTEYTTSYAGSSQPKSYPKIQGIKLGRAQSEDKSAFASVSSRGFSSSSTKKSEVREFEVSRQSSKSETLARTETKNKTETDKLGFKQNLRSTAPWFSERKSENEKNLEKRSSDISNLLKENLGPLEKSPWAREIREISAKLVEMSKDTTARKQQEENHIMEMNKQQNARRQMFKVSVLNRDVVFGAAREFYVGGEVPAGSPPLKEQLLGRHLQQQQQQKLSKSTTHSPRLSPERKYNAFSRSNAK